MEEEEAGGGRREEGRRRRRECRTKNKNPTQRCGEKLIGFWFPTWHADLRRVLECAGFRMIYSVDFLVFSLGYHS